jgi:hypothetical protein
MTNCTSITRCQFLPAGCYRETKDTQNHHGKIF